MVSFPPHLKPKGTVGIISPGRWAETEWIDKTKAFLVGRGYQVVVHAQNYLKEGQLAGNNAARVEGIMDMFADTTIDAILCARGGTGTLHLLDKLDYDLIQNSPKPFIGFSDITALLHAISQRCGFVTYHGPMGVNFGKPDNDPRTGTDFVNVAGNRRKHCRLHYPDTECLRPGKTEGTLTGGNLTLLQNLIGTPFDWSGKDAILFIEDADEPLYKIDRALGHLRLAGKFQGVKAVLVGEMVGLLDGENGSDRSTENPFGSDLKEIVIDHIPPDIPVGFNFPCGHGSYITTLPVGAHVQLTLGSRGAEIAYAVAQAA
jgi:muramoyltetrapeptide carboxypeptidase